MSCPERRAHPALHTPWPLAPAQVHWHYLAGTALYMAELTTAHGEHSVCSKRVQIRVNRA